MENPVTALLQNDLGGFLVPLMLGVRALRKKFAISDRLPTLHEAILVVLMLVLGLGLAFANMRLQKDAAQILTQLWWVQGLLFWLGFIIMDIGFDVTSVRTSSAEAAIKRVGGWLIPIATGAMLFGASPAAAQERGLFDPGRFSAGPRAVAQVYDTADDGPRQFDLALGGAAAWNLTSLWDLNASAERTLLGGDAVPCNWRLSAGTHVRLPFSTDSQSWNLGFERAWYRYSVGDRQWDDGQWAVRLQWAFGARTASGRDWAFAIVRGRYDVEDARNDVGAGVQPQLVGGH